MIPPALAAQIHANALACARPERPARWAHVRDPVTGATLAGYAAADLADLQRQVATFGIELVTIDGALAMLDGPTRRAYDRQVVELGLHPAVPLPAPSAKGSSTWADTPLVPNVERRVRYLVCAADPRHRTRVDQECPPGGEWPARLPGAWHVHDGRLFCGPSCAGPVRPVLPPIVGVEQINDASWRPTARQRPPATERERSMAREVPDRPARVKAAR